MPPPAHRSGFAALIGRPNVGKSTLLNQLAGARIAIVSPKPQTTRNRILGVVTRPEGQVAFLDTPGIHQARGQLNRYMVEVAMAAAGDTDLILYLIDVGPQAEGRRQLGVDRRPLEAQAGFAGRGAGSGPTIGPGNRFILDRLKTLAKPTLLVVNKIDQVAKRVLLPLIELYRHEYPFAEVIPISARTGDGVDRLFERCLSHLPEGPLLFPSDVLTDQAERTLAAELVRE